MAGHRQKMKLHAIVAFSYVACTFLAWKAIARGRFLKLSYPVFQDNAKHLKICIWPEAFIQI